VVLHFGLFINRDKYQSYYKFPCEKYAAKRIPRTFFQRTHREYRF